VRLLFLLLLTLSVAIAEQPFDFNSTPGKLPKNVVPREYAIRIVPDVAKMTFTGSETVKLEGSAAVRELVLNAAEMQIANAALDQKPLTIEPNEKDEIVTLRSDAEIAPGEHTLTLSFTGKINQRGAGLYAATYQEQGTGAKKTMLGTQFEPADARRFFPCWDEPSFRARFQLTAVVPENWSAFSNMPSESESKSEPGAKEVRFGMTPPMSSYLNVFVAGELDRIESRVGATKIGVVATRGKAEMGRYALETTAQILQFYNDYFGVAYPLPKLDQIAVPGGFGGAMENWGGITYYESALLFDPQNSSSETKQNIYAVIAHEMAHQWFGDLVTTAWWDNLWLNEGFASWMGSKCTAKFNPQWEVWNRRSVQRDPTRRTGAPKETAMQGDARATTHAIQQTINNEAEANSAFDDITYRKGQSFLRMLESFLGEDVFRDGIRRYIAAHKYSNSTTTDLWNALGQASGKPVAEIAAGWTEQPGFPIVNVRRDASGKVVLKQERFTVHATNLPPLEWKIPLTYSVVGHPKPMTVLMTTKEMELPPLGAKEKNRPLKLNVGGTGYYRVQYEAALWKQLLQEVPRFSSPDRVNLLADSWALVEANRAPLGGYLDLVRRMGPTTVSAESEQVVNTLDVIDRLLVAAPQRDAFEKYARSILRPAFNQLGWQPKPAEAAPTTMLRGTLIQTLGTFNDVDIVAECRARFQKFVADKSSLPPDLRPAVLAVVGRYADEATWNKLHELGLKTTSIEEKGQLYNALCAALNPQLVEKTLEIALSDELPSSRAVFLVGKVARESEHPEIALQFAQAHTKELLTKTDALGMNSFMPALFTFFSDDSRIAELESYARANLPASAAKEVEKAKDELGFRAEFKQRLLSQIPQAFSFREKLR
jgi:aminopeptidase N